MSRPMALALTGCLIVLIAYIVVTSASLVRELNSTNTAATASVENFAGSTLQVSQPAPNESSKVEIREAQVRSSRRHKLKALNHHQKPRIKQEPIILYL